MKLIALQFARLLLAIGVLYGALLGVSLLLRPREPSAPLDTGRAPESLFLTEPKYVFLGRSRLSTASHKLLLLGASNTMAGFKQRELAPLLPELEVHNLAVGGANITEVAQVAELVREVQSPQARHEDVFVLGLWYGVFAADEARWHTPDRHAGDTDIDIERYRYGFFRRTSAGPVPVLPTAYLDWGVTLIHPYLVLDGMARDGTAALREKLSGKARRLTDAERNARVIDGDEQRDYLAFWRRYMGSVDTLSAAPFERLRRSVEQLLADGSRVILVDMPIPRWHRQGSALAADYRRRLDALLPSLEARPGVTVLRMADADSNDDFSDEVHPKPRVSPLWAQRLADTVKRATSHDEGQPRTPSRTSSTVARIE